MTSLDTSLVEKISLFKETVAADLYSPADIINFDASLTSVDTYAKEIFAIEDLIKKGGMNSANLAEALLLYPRLYQVLCTLLSISTSIQMEDGRILPSPIFPPKTLETSTVTAEILIELGISRLLESPLDTRKLFLVVQIAADAPQRRGRVDQKIKQRAKLAISKVISEISKSSAANLSLVSSSSLPNSAKRFVEYVITLDGLPKIAIALTFQAYSGGRQTREMKTLYPDVAHTLNSHGISLILIADGQGMRGLPEKVLIALLKVIPYTLSLNQAENGGLLGAVENILSAPVRPSFDSSGLKTIIESTLSQRTNIAADALPIESSTARLTLANYLTDNAHLDLYLAPEGASLEWGRPEIINSFRVNRSNFNPSSIIRSTEILLEAKSHSEDLIGTSFVGKIVSIAQDSFLTAPFLLTAYSGTVDSQVLKNISRFALQNAQHSKIAVLLTFEPLPLSFLSTAKSLQSALPVTIAVINIHELLNMAMSKDSPRDQLKTVLLEQTDLTKLSPFVVRGVTPDRVFYGREEEEATLLSTLSTNSVALLGGRRIGKTSLMRHSFGRLEAANLKPVFGDCQVVRTWADFGAMANRQWGTSVSADFKPNDLFELVEQLKDSDGNPVVILLDEIDQLLDWDKTHTDDQVPEAFFRACRSISQQGLAQFVFSGERTIANSLWDASSPHWNFCRPLMLRQLSRSAADSLIAKPLETLGIRIDQREDFLAACWQCTDGHPELLQFIGDKIVAIINARDRKEIYASPQDVSTVTNEYEYAEQYMETYWGQATNLERILSILLIRGCQTIEELISSINEITDNFDGKLIHAALHMLELYGIARQSEVGYELRATWFSTALNFYGGPEVAITRYLGKQ